MVLEDYFDFLASDDIRIKGTRVGIETVLYDHVFRLRSPETSRRAPYHNARTVYATILYYLANKQRVDTT